jgi:hypothetical protein
MGVFADRMDSDMRLRGFAESARSTYLGCVRRFVGYWMVPPDRMSPEHVRRYQLHLTRDRRVAWSTWGVNVAALRFFFGVTPKVPWEIQEVPYQKRGRRLPVVPGAREAIESGAADDDAGGLEPPTRPVGPAPRRLHRRPEPLPSPTRSIASRAPSPEEVAALLNAVTNPKHRALLMAMYSAGLRVSWARSRSGSATSTARRWCSASKRARAARTGT